MLLYLIGEEIPKRSVSDGRGLNGLSSTRGGRRKALNRSPGSSEPGRRPRSRGRRANETHRTRGPTGRTVGGGSLNGPNQRLSHVPSTSHQRRVLAPRRGDRAPLHDRYMRLSLPQGGWLALAHLSRNSFGNLTPRKKPRFRKFPGKSDLRRRVGWVQYAPTRRSRSVSYVSPIGTFRHFDAQAVSLVGLRAPSAIRPRGMSSSESPRDRLSRLRKRGLLSLDEYLREIELLDAEDNAAQARDETADRRSAASSANGRTGDSDEHLVDEDGMPYKPSPNRARHAAGGSGRSRRASSLPSLQTRHRVSASSRS